MKKIFTAIIFLTAFLLFAQTKNSVLIRQLNTEIRILIEQKREAKIYAELLEQKNEIILLIEKNKAKKVRKLFLKQAKIIDYFLEEDKINSAVSKLNELKFIFGEIHFLADLFLYYDAKIALFKGEDNLAVDLLEKLLTQFPDSETRNFAILELENIYFLYELDWKFIGIYNQFDEEKTDLQKYRFAHCNYNIGNIADAKSMFQVLLNSKDFSFRAKSMLALVSYFSKGVKPAILEFQTLENSYQKNPPPHYYFVLLSLARLFAEQNEFDKSLAYYEKFYQMHQEKVDDGVLYEIATQYKNVGKYENSLTYLRRIVAVSQKTKYFAPAKFLIAVIEQELGNLDNAEQHLEDVILPNNEFLETLTSKYDLLNKYNDLQRQVIADSENIKLKTEILETEKHLQNTNLFIENYYAKLDSSTVTTLRELEIEYLHYCETIAEIDAVIQFRETTQNRELLPIVDDAIAKEEASLVLLQMMKYLANVKNISTTDYEIAKALAVERIYENSLLEMWNKIEQTAKINNFSNMLIFIKKSQNLIEGNIASLDLIAKYKFNPQISDEALASIKAEAENIEHNKNELLALREDILNNLNKKIAQKLSKKRKILFDEFAEIKVSYQQSIDSMKKYIGRENQEGTRTLLDVLFKQTQKIDAEFEELREDFKQDE